MDEKAKRKCLREESEVIEGAASERYREPDIPAHVNEAIDAVIDYLWDDELQDARQVYQRQSRVRLDGHVFVHLVTIRAWREHRYLPVEMFFDDLPTESALFTHRFSGGCRGGRLQTPQSEKTE